MCVLDWTGPKDKGSDVNVLTPWSCFTNAQAERRGHGVLQHPIKSHFNQSGGSIAAKISTVRVGSVWYR